MSLVLAVLMVGMLMMAGLVIDGGAAIAAREHATDVAQQAARAGADALSPDSLRTGTPAGLRTDPVAATAAADRVLSAAGITGEETVSGDTVTVTAHVRRRTAILSAVGISNADGSGTASATVVHGTATGGG